MSNVTIQPSTADTYLSDGNPTTNYGAGTTVNLANISTLHWRSIVSFDFHSLVPSLATIISATLSMYFYSFATGRTLTVYRLLRTDWIEAQATWNIYKTGSNWGTAGALGSGVDFTPTDAVAMTSLNGAGWLSWNVKNQVQTARNSVGGVAHFIIEDTGAPAAGTGQGMYSREYVVDTSLCPKLYIEYTTPLTGASFLLRMI
jgi:hypothetical protein